MSVKELKAFLARREYDLSTCTERSDLVALAKRAVEEADAKRQMAATTRGRRASSVGVASMVGSITSESFWTTPGGGFNAANERVAPSGGSMFEESASVATAPRSGSFSLRGVGGRRTSNSSTTMNASGRGLAMLGLAASGGGGAGVPLMRETELRADRGDVVVSARGLGLPQAAAQPPKQAAPPSFSAAADANALRSVPLFGDGAAADVAAKSVSRHFGGRKWTVGDLSVMGAPQLRELLDLFGTDHADCRNVSALRERARMSLLWLGEGPGGGG